MTMKDQGERKMKSQEKRWGESTLDAGKLKYN